MICEEYPLSKNLFRAKIFKIYHKFQTNIIHYRNHSGIMFGTKSILFLEPIILIAFGYLFFLLKGYTSVGAAVTAPVSLTFLCLLVFTLLVQPSVCSFLGNNSELFFFQIFFSAHHCLVSSSCVFIVCADGGVDW